VQTTWNDLIKRSRTYVDDDHADEAGWIAVSTWLDLFQTEYGQLYRRWVREGLVRPKPTDTAFTGTTNLTSVLAIVGVAQDMGSYVRILNPAQSVSGADPFWFPTSPVSGVATSWAAHGAADDLSIELNPANASSYVVRWLPAPARATDPTTTVSLPFGGDERLVLGVARKAHIKESAASRRLDDEIRDADAELAFTAFGRNGDSPRVRRVRPRVDLHPRHPGFPTDSRSWFFPL